MRRRYKRWKKFGHVWALLVVLTLVGCGKDTLNETTFSEPLEKAGMAVGDSIGTEMNNNTITMWKVSYDDDGSEVQYIECDDETAAKNFFNQQVNAFKDITGTGGSSNYYRANSDGYFYYACLVDNKVVIATGKSKNWTAIREILDKIPELS